MLLSIIFKRELIPDWVAIHIIFMSFPNLIKFYAILRMIFFKVLQKFEKLITHGLT